jgi:uncharacterized protein YndB with AHSA1/START domain
MTTNDPAGTTTTGSSTQVYQLYIRAGSDEVWKAITDPATVARFFFGQRREADYQVGGRIRSWSPDGSQPWGDNVVLECDPPRRLVHSWRSLYDPELAAEPESRVTCEIAAIGDGLSRLTMIHDHLDASPRTAASVRGWSYVLSNLKTVIETGESLPPIT